MNICSVLKQLYVVLYMFATLEPPTVKWVEFPVVNRLYHCRLQWLADPKSQSLLSENNH